MPNFIVIGAAKCGTTSLCDLLGRHPEIFMTEPKEPRYFSDNAKYGNTLGKQKYEKHFCNVNNEIAVGEGTTTYTHPRVAALCAQRIADDLPFCKFIFIARNPIKRIESDWRMRVVEGWADPSINVAVVKNSSLIEHSLYWKNVQEYVRLFPQEQILFLLLEEFMVDPEDAMSRCFRFLEVDDSVLLRDGGRPRNSSTALRKYGRVFSEARKSKHLQSCWESMPNWVQAVLRNVLTRKEKVALDWDESVREMVWERVRDDAQMFLENMGYPKEFWTN